MAEDEAPGPSASYLAKVAAAVVVLAGIAFFGAVPEWPGLPDTVRRGVLAASALVCVATVPFAAWRIALPIAAPSSSVSASSDGIARSVVPSIFTGVPNVSRNARFIRAAIVIGVRCIITQ